MSSGQRKTALVLLGAVALLVGLFLGLLLWEAKTLANDIPDDHITAVIQIAWRNEPGAILFATNLWTGVTSVLAAHWFWGAGKKGGGQ